MISITNESTDGAAPEADEQLMRVKSDALRLLSFSPRSVAELKERLAKKNYPREVIDRAIELLTRQGLLNDEKFAELYAGAKVHSRPVGRKQLEMDLKRKGLAPEVVQKSLEKLTDYDERATALELVRRRFEKMSGLSDQKKKARLFGFLKRRGFSHEIIFSVLEELVKGD